MPTKHPDQMRGRLELRLSVQRLMLAIPPQERRPLDSSSKPVRPPSHTSQTHTSSPTT
jgi:hypothetical protein